MNDNDFKIEELTRKINDLKIKKAKLLKKEDPESKSTFKNFAIYVDKNEYTRVLSLSLLRHMSLSKYIKMFMYEMVKDCGMEYDKNRHLYHEKAQNFKLDGEKRLITVSLNEQECKDYLIILHKIGIKNADALRFIIDKILYMSSDSDSDKEHDSQMNMRARYDFRPITFDFKTNLDQSTDINVFLDKDIYDAVKQYAMFKGKTIEELMRYMINKLEGPRNFISVPYGWEYEREFYDIKSFKIRLSSKEVDVFLKKIEGLFCGEAKYLRGVIVWIYEKVKEFNSEAIPQRFR